MWWRFILYRQELKTFKRRNTCNGFFRNLSIFRHDTKLSLTAMRPIFWSQFPQRRYRNLILHSLAIFPPELSHFIFNIILNSTLASSGEILWRNLREVYCDWNLDLSWASDVQIPGEIPENIKSFFYSDRMF